jgi:tetratricopeptide (TPR) repeat protein
MSKIRTLPLAALCVFIASCATGPKNAPSPTNAPASNPLTVSESIALPLRDAQAAMLAKDYAGAVAAARALESRPSLTAYDRHAINEIMGYCYAHTGELTRAADYLERGFNDGYLGTKERQQRVIALASINYQLRNYTKSVFFGSLAVNEKFADETTYVITSQAYYLQGNYQATANFTDKHVRDTIAAGSLPSEGSLQLILSSCEKLGERACELRVLQQLVRYYPKPRYASMIQALQPTAP